jgi:hypothetical protein
MAQIKLVKNPAPRKRRRTVAKRKSPVRRRRNPIKKNDIMSQVTNGLVAGTGAVGLDVALGVLPIPADYKSGPMAPLVKAGVALAIGMGLEKSKLVKKKTSQDLVGGMLAVTAHSALKPIVSGTLPNITLAEYTDLGYISSAYPMASQSFNTGLPSLGEYTDLGGVTVASGSPFADPGY